MTVCLDTTLDQVLALLGQEKAVRHELATTAVWDVLDEDETLLVVVFHQLGTAVVMAEDNGWQGSRPEVLRALGSGGQPVVSAYWNVNWSNQFSVVSHGRVSTMHYLEDPVDDELVLDMEIVRRHGAPGGWKDGFLEALERRTGIHVDDDLFTRPGTALVLHDLVPPLPPEPSDAAST